MDSAVILRPIILDLNADDQQDFLFFPADFGEVQTGEPPNLILAVLSDTNGEYVIGHCHNKPRCPTACGY